MVRAVGRPVDVRAYADRIVMRQDGCIDTTCEPGRDDAVQAITSLRQRHRRYLPRC